MIFILMIRWSITEEERSRREEKSELAYFEKRSQRVLDPQLGISKDDPLDDLGQNAHFDQSLY